MDSLMASSMVDLDSIRSAAEDYIRHANRFARRYNTILQLCESSGFPAYIFLETNSNKVMMDLVMTTNITSHTHVTFSGWKCALEKNGVHIIAYADVSLIAEFINFRAGIIVGVAVAIVVLFACCVYYTARHCVRRRSYTVKQESEETHCPIAGLAIPDDDFLHTFIADSTAAFSSNGVQMSRD